MRDRLEAGAITIAGAHGDEVEAYVAHPVDRTRSGGVVVIHHMPGFDAATKEISRRFAAWGWSAICPNLHYRDAPGAASDDASAASRASGGVPDERLLGDVAGAAAYLRAHTTSNGRVATIGFCSGGRQSLLAGCALEVDAVVDCYGAFVLHAVPAELGLTVSSIESRLPDLSCPVLGLFGKQDKNPAPEEVAALDRLLTDLGKEHEFHSFDDAGHAFFAVDRPAYRPAAATEGWRLVREFLNAHLATEQVNA